MFEPCKAMKGRKEYLRREIVLDTETTGLDWLDGHQIVEIGAIELMNAHDPPSGAA
jgi:DNA polymerase III epsilon subunit-like protein